jgi:hypothetical protein
MAQYIEIQSNNISGSIPANLLSGLSHLILFRIGDNPLTGTLPVGLTTGLTSLEWFSLHTTDIS